MILDYLSGGDLRYHIGKNKKFTEEQTKFFISCILECLEYLHSNQILHRDLKPENLVLDKKGYLKVTDLGIARIKREENYQDTSGTPGYMAPEILMRKNHSFEVDFFALGVIMHEFMLGRVFISLIKRPYIGRNRQEIKEQIMAKQVVIRLSDMPSGWTGDALDFVNRLLQRKPD